MRKNKEKTYSAIVKFYQTILRIFTEFYRICKIEVVSLVTTVSCEKSLSCLKLLKTHLRLTIDRRSTFAKFEFFEI